MTVLVGDLGLWLLPLGDSAPPFPQAETIGTSTDVAYAADTVSQDLVDIVGPLTETADEHDWFVPDVMSLNHGYGYDQLLVLTSVEVDPRVRGHRIGAWAVARALNILASNPLSLISLMAAPLHRESFMPVVSRDDAYRDLSTEEQAAWDAAQAGIHAHWQDTLGLRPLAGHPLILVGIGDLTQPQRRATIAAWSR